jgi:hypothetical protein
MSKTRAALADESALGKEKKPSPKKNAEVSVVGKDKKSSSKTKVAAKVVCPEESDSDGLDDETNSAVEHATNIIASMPSLEAVQDVMQEVKSRVRCLVYSGEIGLLFKQVLMCDDKINPFKKPERSQLNAIFNRCSVDAHETFKDSECTLTLRKEVCGASTTFICHGRNGGACVFTMTWYWRPDEEMGFMEEFSMVYRHEDNDEPSDSVETDEDMILEGCRSLLGGLKFDVNLPVLQIAQAHLECKCSAQALLRFLVLCCRTECSKCQDRINSITHGFSREEDAEEVCRFLADFVVDGAAPDADDASPSQAGKAAPRRPAGKAAPRRGAVGGDEDAARKKRRR